MLSNNKGSKEKEKKNKDKNKKDKSNGKPKHLSAPKKKGSDESGTPKERRKIIADNFSELPEDIKKRVRDAKLEEDVVNKSFPVLLSVLHFLTKDSYQTRDEVPAKKDHAPYATEQTMDTAKRICKVSEKGEKEMKKIYKNMTMSGKGGFGRVYYGREISSPKRKVAIKKVPHETEKQKRDNWSEIGFLHRCNHPNIVKFYDAFDMGSEMWIVTEFLEGGTLSEAANRHQFSEQHIGYIAREMLKALTYLHSNKMVHRDLKSANVMMSIDAEIKLIDFGLCCELVNGERLQMLGSPYWMPPEMIQRKHHGYPADIWSFAVCLLEMYLRHPPNIKNNLFAMFTAGTAGLQDCIPSTVSANARDFLTRSLELDPAKRATAAELLQHPFVTQPKLEDGIKDVLRDIFISANLDMSGI
jgi:hypothetical protein